MSFFYLLPTASSASQSPSNLLNATQIYAMCWQNNVLSLRSDLLLDLPQATEFAADSSNEHTNILRLFGAQLSWTAVAKVLQILSVEGAVFCRLHKPHQTLAGALELTLRQPLDAETQRSLQELAVQQDIELVYLTARPVLAKPGVLVMDMDSTAIQIECIDEIAKLAGVGAQVTAITAQAMNGELDFAQSLTARVAALKGTPEAILQQVLTALPLMPGLTALVQHLQAHHWQVAIASGGFTYYTNALQQQLGLTATFANVLEIIDGHLSGNVVGAIVDASTKARVVQDLALKHAIDLAQTVAIGDGANDIPMLQAAALGVAFHAKPKVQTQAKAAIRQGSLLQLLYLLD